MYKFILCPIDGSETSQRGLTQALQLAKDQDATLCLLHVLDLSVYTANPPIIEGIYDQLRQDARNLLHAAAGEAKAAGVKAETQLVEIRLGRVAPVIVEDAQQRHADLIVMGTHGRRGISRLFAGSDAAEVVATAPVPVMLVR